MAKKVIISENMAKELIARQIIEEGDLTKADVASAVKDAIKNDRDVKKEFDKQVRALVANSVNLLFRTLWQRRNFYEDEIKRG